MLSSVEKYTTICLPIKSKDFVKNYRDFIQNPIKLVELSTKSLTLTKSSQSIVYFQGTQYGFAGDKSLHGHTVRTSEIQ